jgi:hypothetical protein
MLNQPPRDRMIRPNNREVVTKPVPRPVAAFNADPKPCLITKPSPPPLKK